MVIQELFHLHHQQIQEAEEQGLRRVRRLIWGWIAAFLVLMTMGWMQWNDDLAQLRFECETQRVGWEWDDATDTCQLKQPKKGA